MLQRRLDALLARLGCTQLGRLRLAHGMPRVRLGLCLDRLHQLAGLFEMFLQARLAAKRGRPGFGAHAHSVLCHSLKMDGTGRRQCGHVVGEEFIHQRGVTGAKVVDRVVVHRHATANPAVRVMLLTQPRDFAPTAHAL